MDIRGRGAVVDDEFGFCVGFDVVFVAVVNFFVFCGPAGIAVFLFAFGAALLKAFGAFSCFDFFILLAGVALARRGDKAGIDDAAFASDDALGGEIFSKCVKRRWLPFMPLASRRWRNSQMVLASGM